MNHKLSLPYWQKGLYLLFIVVMVTGLVVSVTPVQRASAAEVNASQKSVITIEALIDGRSQLILKDKTAQWYHLDFSVPGRWGDINDPTIINGKEWFPSWPDVPDTYNYNCYCYSDVYKGVKTKSPRNMTVALNVLEARGPVSIVEYPSASNDYAVVIEFNDNDYDAAATYKIELVVSSSANKHNITVEALIDGRSQLTLRKNTAQWSHLDFAAPGRHEFVNVSTVINGKEWFPVWPDVPDTENRDCQCYSSRFKGLKPALQHKPPLEINVLQGRGTVTIVEYPSKANRYALVIEFDDNAYDGSATYQIEIVLKSGNKP